MYKVKIIKGKYAGNVATILAKYTAIDKSKILIVELESDKKRIEVPEEDTEDI